MQRRQRRLPAQDAGKAAPVDGGVHQTAARRVGQRLAGRVDAHIIQDRGGKAAAHRPLEAGLAHNAGVRNQQIHFSGSKGGRQLLHREVLQFDAVKGQPFRLRAEGIRDQVSAAFILLKDIGARTDGQAAVGAPLFHDGNVQQHGEIRLGGGQGDAKLLPGPGDIRHAFQPVTEKGSLLLRPVQGIEQVPIAHVGAVRKTDAFPHGQFKGLSAVRRGPIGTQGALRLKIRRNADQGLEKQRTEKTVHFRPAAVRVQRGIIGIAQGEPPVIRPVLLNGHRPRRRRGGILRIIRRRRGLRRGRRSRQAAGAEQQQGKNYQQQPLQTVSSLPFSTITPHWTPR